MYGTTDPITRQAFITSLRALADYLAAHPDVPVPPTWHETTILIHATGTQAEQYAEVDHIAELLGTPVNDETNNGLHYSTERAFGNLVYGCLAIPDAARALHDAVSSYYGSITPDADDEDDVSNWGKTTGSGAQAAP